MQIYLRVLRESFYFAINALRTNLTRTFLSLLGVTIGIFSIIGVLAAIDSLRNNIDKNLSSLDNSTIYVLRFSFGPTDLEPYQYENFPDMSYDEYQMLKRNLPDLGAITYTMFSPPENIKYQGKSVSAVNINPGTEDQYELEGLQLDKGRFYSETESVSGAAVIVLGNEVAQSLFGDTDPLGKRLRMYGNKVTVVGVLKKSGASGFGPSKDETAYIPVNFSRRIFGNNNRAFTSAIILKPEKGVDQDAFIANMSQQLRNYRGLKSGDLSTFFVNPLKGFTDFIEQITGVITIIGVIISGFSMLVGGFGIANIMFVSVKERTNLIGIQKSLGAKNKFILSQFLFEAVILALFGGLFGLLFVWIGTLIATSVVDADDFEFILSLKNILIGTGISAAIGLIAGIIPAISASRLDPVEAIRTGI